MRTSPTSRSAGHAAGPLLLAILAGCGSNVADPATQPLLTIRPNPLVLNSGDSLHVRLGTRVGEAVTGTQFWLDYGQPGSNNGLAARVDAGGLVTAIEPGHATLAMLVHFQQHSDSNAYVAVTVRGVRGTTGATANTAYPPPTLYIYGSGAGSYGSVLTLGQFAVVDTVPVDSTVRFASPDTAVFTVASAGPTTASLTARGVGQALLSVTSVGNPALRGTVPVTVVHCAVRGLAKDGGCAQVGP